MFIATSAWPVIKVYPQLERVIQRSNREAIDGHTDQLDPAVDKMFA